MKKFLSAAVFGLALVGLASLALVTGFSRPPLDYSEELAARPLVGNSAGQMVLATLIVDETAHSGILTLPLDGGVFTALTGAADGGMAAGDTDGTGCITTSTAAGTFTVAAGCAGELEFRASITNVDEGNTAKAVFGSWSRTRAGVTTQIGQKALKTELVDAGANAPMGDIVARDLAAAGDVYFFSYATSGSTAATTTTKGATLTVLKLTSN